MTIETDSSAGPQVIARAAAILRVLEGQTRGLSIAQITRLAELPRTTVHRLVTALQAQQMVSIVEGSIYLGPAITRLAGGNRHSVTDIVRPHIESLNRHTHETVNLSVLRGNFAVLVDQVPSDQELRIVTPVGTALPLYCTAHGKALLADMNDREMGQRLSGNWERKTDRTLTSLEDLQKEIRQIRLAGFACDRDENIEGVSGLGLVLKTGTPERYALSIVMPSVRFHQHPSVVKFLLECAEAITAGFG